MEAAGYDVTIQPFDFVRFTEVTPGILEQTAPDPVGPLPNIVMTYSGSGEAAGPVTVLPAPPTDPTPGCEPGDFPASTAGTIALISRGACAFAIKATNAAGAGAVGVVIYNNIAGDLNGTLGSTFDLDIPVTGITMELGQQLAATAGLELQPRDRYVERARHHIERARREDREERGQCGHGRSTPRFGSRRARDQRQRIRIGSDPRGRRADGQGQAPKHLALRLVGSRGSEPRRFQPLREHPERGGARQDRPLPELRHGRLAEPCVLHLRR